VAANTNGVAAGSHDNHDVLNKKSEISDVNIMFESEPRVTERGSPSLVGRGIANLVIEEDFRNYLITQNRSNVRQLLCYARKYHAVLVTGDASIISKITSPSVRHHILESLTVLAKWCGLYDRLKDIIAKYQLRWGSAAENNLRYFTNYLQGNSNFGVMIAWLKDTLKRLPVSLGSVLLYNTLSGLRFSEALLSIKLIQTDLERYANKDLGMLENFRYPEFIRKKTKKSYLTIYDDSILEIARKARLVNSWDAFRKQLVRRNIETIHTKYCRAIYATFLRQYGGIEQEVISIYQGRAPSSIFHAHYLKTNVREDRERILKAVHQLKERIEC
jgi:Archaeal phage integrase